MRDERGFFTEVYSRKTCAALGIDAEFVQDNHSFSAARGTVRGLHFQSPPWAQDKLVWVLRGRIFDVALDLRRESPGYGRHVSFVIGAGDGRQIFIPKGFAHGFCTLEPNTEVLYKTSAYYAPEHERGVRWDDPDLRIEWPVRPDEAILSSRDRRWPRLKALRSESLWEARPRSGARIVREVE